MNEDEKRLGWNSVGVQAGNVNIWMIPLWLKGNRAIKCIVSPEEARYLAIKLLQAAERADRQP